MSEDRFGQPWIVDLEALRATRGDIVVRLSQEDDGSFSGFVLEGSDGTLDGDLLIVKEAVEALELAQQKLLDERSAG